jgi:hypothetical protein
MEFTDLTVGSLVYVTSYGPCWGLKGTICAVDSIIFVDAQENPLYFYLVALQEGQTKEPLWLVHDDVAPVEGDDISQGRPSKKQPSRLEIEALEIVANMLKRELDSNPETLLTA